MIARILAALALLAALGLLIVGCAPRRPSRWQWLLTDPEKCSAAPADDTCVTCWKTACCSETYACVATTHTACDVAVACLQNHCAEPCHKDLAKLSGRPR